MLSKDNIFNYSYSCDEIFILIKVKLKYGKQWKIIQIVSYLFFVNLNKIAT